MTMIHTRYSHLTNEELLRDVLHDSDLSDRELELVSRMEALLDENGGWRDTAAEEREEAGE